MMHEACFIVRWRDNDMEGKGGSRIRAVQVDNLRGLMGNWRTDRVLNSKIR